MLPASPWFRFTETAPGVWRIDEPHVSEFMQANAWLIRGRDRWLLVDTLNGIERLSDALPSQAMENLTVVLTHGHADHAGSAHEFGHVLAPAIEAEGIATADPMITLAGPGYGTESLAGLIVGPPRLTGPLVTAPPPSGAPGFAGPRPTAVARTLSEGDQIDLGNRAFSVIALPGHSPAASAFMTLTRRFSSRATRSTKAVSSTTSTTPTARPIAPRCTGCSPFLSRRSGPVTAPNSTARGCAVSPANGSTASRADTARYALAPRPTLAITPDNLRTGGHACRREPTSSRS